MNIECPTMDLNRIVAALKATIDPNEREAAEKYLVEMQKIIGFAPTLLQIVTSEQIEGPVRQAGIIYLKNLITSYWDEKNDAADQSKQDQQPKISVITDQDRHVIREAIVGAVINSPEVIRVQLAVCVSKMIKFDFPARWPTVVDKIITYLNGSEVQAWPGALVVLYQLVKAYEFKKPEEREPLIESMKIVLPILFERMTSLMQDASQDANYLQKMILKIFYALVQFSLNLNMISLEEFANWMEIVRQVVNRPVPAETLSIDEEDRPNLVWWKCKKWAMHLMTRIFERYGNPGQVAAEYNQFAEFYLKNFVAPSMETVLKVLDAHRRKEYVSPAVLFQAISYLQAGVGHSFSWKFLKTHIMEVITDIVFPLASHSEADEELWTDDPQEYISQKYDIMTELIDPTNAAMGLLSESVKRKDLLSKVVQFICQVLNNAQSTPQNLDGALHMIGALAPSLLKKKIYKAELENMLVAHIFTRFEAQNGFLRARACWCLQMFSEVSFKNEENLTKAISLVLNALFNDPELPVKVEAALALQMLLSDQPKIEPLVETQIKPICLSLLDLIRQTENDDLTNVVQKLINTYTEKIIPIAVEIAQYLASIFINLVQNEQGEDKAITAIGILNTLEVVMDAVEEKEEIMKHLEPVIIEVVKSIIDNSVMEFYEEACVLINGLTMQKISTETWKLFDTIYNVFTTEAFDYFMDMMPALHNYITVDPEAFLSNPQRLEMVFNMCKKILQDESLEDAQCHAAKLLEVVVLQFRGRIDPVIRSICEVVLERLVKNVESSELRIMCLQVLIAVLHYNPILMLHTLQTFQAPDASMNLVDLFIKQWLCDSDCFLGVHDRKMYLIGLSTLMRLPQRPQVMQEVCEKLLPSCLSLYDGLEKAYKLKAQRDNEIDESDSGEEEEELDGDALASDEDEIDAETHDYMEKLSKSEQDSGNDDVYSESDFVDETDLEMFETVLDGESAEVDEYVLFKETLLQLQTTEPQWYGMLTQNLNQEQVEALKKVFSLADQRQAMLESKKIDKSGGYQFNVQQEIPHSFNFGSP